MSTVELGVRILGTRGIPARYGGFETFAERLALYLAERNWDVTVYCQEPGHGEVEEDVWKRVRRVHVPVLHDGTWGSIVFDWIATWHAATPGYPVLLLGYNTALFSLIHRARHIPVFVNMDGLEWRRGKWGIPAKLWLYLNERIGTKLASHLIADHPVVETRLRRLAPRKRITMIPYGADKIENADPAIIQALDLEPDKYLLIVARIEPENSILETVRAFVAKSRPVELVVVGSLKPEMAYHRAVQREARGRVRFVGPIYDQRILRALRFFAHLYVHGHTVGGTNPSLVEALGAGSAILARDNAFNRWVAGPGAWFFKDEQDCERMLDTLIGNDDELTLMRQASSHRFASGFGWSAVLPQYERLLKTEQRDLSNIVGLP